MIGASERFVKCEMMPEGSTKRDRLLGVEIRHLAALEAIADTGSFAAAARMLGYSQSAVSQQIATLERAAGARLLDRPVGKRTVTVTDAGERLLRHARRVAGAMRAAGADLDALARGELGTLHVGTFPSASVRLLPRVMRDFVNRRPGIEVRLFEADYEDELIERLRNGALELCFRLRTDEPVPRRGRRDHRPVCPARPSRRSAGSREPARARPRRRRPPADRLQAPRGGW